MTPPSTILSGLLGSEIVGDLIGELGATLMVASIIFLRAALSFSTLVRTLIGGGFIYLTLLGYSLSPSSLISSRSFTSCTLLSRPVGPPSLSYSYTALATEMSIAL
jgi:hypothetical protein